jgi:replication-associated recombination protein RarA
MKTNSGHELDVVSSALQKCIRRGMEWEALWCAMELAESGYDLYVWKRLVTVAVEDVGLANPQAIVVVNSCRDCWMAFRKNEKEETRLPEMHILTMAVLTLCRSPKNREVDDLTYIMWWKRKNEGLNLEMPEWVKDGHTAEGKEKLREQAETTGRTYMDLWNEEFYEDVARLDNPVDCTVTKPDGTMTTDWMKEVSKFARIRVEKYLEPVKGEPFKETRKKE